VEIFDEQLRVHQLQRRYTVPWGWGFFFFRICFAQLCQGQIITCAKGGEKNKWNERNKQAEGEKGERERHDRKKVWKKERKERQKRQGHLALGAAKFLVEPQYAN